MFALMTSEGKQTYLIKSKVIAAIVKKKKQKKMNTHKNTQMMRFESI